MADEIPNQNVIRVSRDGLLWAALIGPDLAQGLCGFGMTPTLAILGLASRMARSGWILDESWKPGSLVTAATPANVIALHKPPPASFSDWHCWSCARGTVHRSGPVALAALALLYGDDRYDPAFVPDAETEAPHAA
jgi:hypothetical protein